MIVKHSDFERRGIFFFALRCDIVRNLILFVKKLHLLLLCLVITWL